MATRIPQVYEAAVEVQASGAVSADTLSAGAQTALINDIADSAPNSNGAYMAMAILVQTVAATAPTLVQLWVEESDDGATYARPRWVGNFENTATGSIRYVTWVPVLAPYTKWKWKPIDYGITASLEIVPAYIPEVQA